MRHKILKYFLYNCTIFIGIYFQLFVIQWSYAVDLATLTVADQNAILHATADAVAKGKNLGVLLPHVRNDHMKDNHRANASFFTVTEARMLKLLHQVLTNPDHSVVLQASRQSLVVTYTFPYPIGKDGDRALKTATLVIGLENIAEAKGTFTAETMAKMGVLITFFPNSYYRS